MQRTCLWTSSVNGSPMMLTSGSFHETDLNLVRHTTVEIHMTCFKLIQQLCHTVGLLLSSIKNEIQNHIYNIYELIIIYPSLPHFTQRY